MELREGLNSSTADIKPEGPLSYTDRWVIKDLPRWVHDGLPSGWMKSTHCSGIPLYVHKESMVVSLSKPYYLVSEDMTTHCIPVSAIPCMLYNRACDITRATSANDGTASMEQSTVGDYRESRHVEQMIDHASIDSWKRETGPGRGNSALGVAGQKRNALVLDRGTACEYVDQRAHKTARNSEDNGHSLLHIARVDEDASNEKHPTGTSNCPSLDIVPSRDQATKPNDIARPTISSSAELGVLSETELRDYCSKKFHFEKVQVPVFSTFAAKCKHKQFQKLQMLNKIVSSSSKANEDKETYQPNKTADKSKKDNRTLLKEGIHENPIQMLARYCSRRYKTNLRFEKLDSISKTFPFRVQAMIGERILGEGCGTSVKASKYEACELALKIINRAEAANETESFPIPHNNDDRAAIDIDSKSRLRKPSSLTETTSASREVDDSRKRDDDIDDRQQTTPLHVPSKALSTFSEYSITNRTIHDVSVMIESPTPYDVLRRMIRFNLFRHIGGVRENVRSDGPKITAQLICQIHDTAVGSGLQHVGKNQHSIVESAHSFKGKAEACSLAAQRIIANLFPSADTWSHVLILVQRMELISTGPSIGHEVINWAEQNNPQRFDFKGLDMQLITILREAMRTLIKERATDKKISMKKTML